MHDGRVIAERYAPGIGVDTPLLSHSIAKSVTNALVGILVRDGKLSLDRTLASPAWDARRERRPAPAHDLRPSAR